MQELQQVFEELDKLNEEYQSKFLSNYWDKERYSASKSFWAQVKNNLIDVRNFHIAYDNKLDELGLLNQFNDDGTIKSKASYGVFKNQDQNEWAIKASLKFCGMQFWDNCKTVEQDREEKEEAERQRREEKRKQQEEKNARLKELTDSLGEFTKIIVDTEDLGQKEFFEKHLKIERLNKEVNLEQHFSKDSDEKLKKQIEEIDKIDLDAELKNMEIKAKYSYWPNSSFYNGTYISIEPENKKVLHCGLRYAINIELRCDDVLDKKKSEVKSVIIEKIKKDIENKSKELDKEIDNEIINLKIQKDRNQKEKERLAKCEEIRQEIIDAVNKNQQPRQEIIDMLVNLIHSTLDSASSAAADWYGPHDDGDSGAAYAMELYAGEQEFDDYTHDTHWESEKSSWHGGTEEEYERAVGKLFSNETKTIKFVK